MTDNSPWGRKNKPPPLQGLKDIPPLERPKQENSVWKDTATVPMPKTGIDGYNPYSSLWMSGRQMQGVIQHNRDRSAEEESKKRKNNSSPWDVPDNKKLGK